MTRPLLAALLAATVPTIAHAQADAWWGHVTVLAHDSMRGRETGSPEHRKAAEYVASVFRRAGLRPAGSDGWFQPVRFRVRRVNEARSSLALVRGGRPERLAFGTEATINLRGSSAGQVDAPLVFIGYGMVSPEHDYDDLKGLALKGKVAVVLTGAPAGLTGPALAAGRAAGAEALRAAGVIGVVSVASPNADLPWERHALSRLHPQMRLATDTASPGGGSSSIVVTLNPAIGERLFAGAPQRYAALQALADSGVPLPRFELPVRLRATVALDESDAVSDNVVGLLPGSHPHLASEHVALTAHLDHLGVGQPQAGDSIYNGAMDNASGIATLLEAATALGRRQPRPSRSVLFVAVTGEEKGLLGSDWFAGHPTVADGAIVANLNTDMFLPLNPLRQLLVNGLEESDLADDVRRAAARADIDVITDPEPERNAFVRSDQFSFIRRGIPALSLKGGFALGTPEHERVLQWRKERYHGVEDEVTQPVNRQAAEAFNRLYPEVILEVANRATRPAWYPTSSFRPETTGSH